METSIYEKIAANKERFLTLWQAAVLPQGNGLKLKAIAKTRSTVSTDCLLKAEAQALFDWLISGEDPVMARSSLQEICKLKAIQAISPSEALSFILDLKDIVRLILSEEELTSSDLKGLRESDKRIDQLMLLAFDEYADCREQIMEIRINEIRRLCGRSA